MCLPILCNCELSPGTFAPAPQELLLAYIMPDLPAVTPMATAHELPDVLPIATVLDLSAALPITERA